MSNQNILTACKPLTVVRDTLGKEGEVLMTAEARTRKTVIATIAQGEELGAVLRTKGKGLTLVEGRHGQLWVHLNHHTADTKYNNSRKTK